MKKKILMLEDDGFLASIYAQKLEQSDFEVTLATNGEDGLRLIKKDLPDLILMDILMPVMNGFELLEKLKAEEKFKKIPVLVLSNLGQKEDVERCLNLGATSYLIKAHTLPHEAVSKINEILKNK